MNKIELEILYAEIKSQFSDVGFCNLGGIGGLSIEYKGVELTVDEYGVIHLKKVINDINKSSEDIWDVYYYMRCSIETAIQCVKTIKNNLKDK